jgi:hypothetical protein
MVDIKESAHRLLLWLMMGPPPKPRCIRVNAPQSMEWEVMHSCHRKWCLNPLHLFWGTRKQNHYQNQSKPYLTLVAHDHVALGVEGGGPQPPQPGGEPQLVQPPQGQDHRNIIDVLVDARKVYLTVEVPQQDQQAQPA